MEPYLWLRHDVLQALPAATAVEQFEALLPWNLKAEQLTPPRRPTKSLIY